MMKGCLGAIALGFLIAGFVIGLVFAAYYLTPLSIR